MPPPPARQAPSEPALRLADRLHSAAIHLLRRLRAADAPAGLTAPRLSALSVVVFGGPIAMGELAAAEQVRPPTMTRVVQELERDGLVTRRADPADERVQRVFATAKGKRVLQAGRRRRVRTLAADLARLSPAQRRALARAIGALERVALPAAHPTSRRR